MSAVDTLKAALGLEPRRVFFAVSPDAVAWAALERAVAPARCFESEFWAGHGFRLPDYSPSTKQVWLRARDLALAARGPTLEDWLEDPMRTVDEVRRALVQAISRAKTGERR